ncbi:pentapeptide repeat-containing protein [Paracoccus fistulariae]|uniref:Pentapeptide repeat-containing protein n=1 Tax=Paracoccus fistulariae TaxID=658446 RepID=A0ABY7SQG8_9RHOB|nr:pentapeptide repeat-containing protein [Paracoccus fistulariae]WCR08257.1 pentapeptide repeat-containing protein [Paracoccus fistulariae]
MAKPENTKQSLVEALGIETEPDWGPARHVLRGLGVLLVGIYILAVIVAVMVLVQVADGNGASLGAGALVVALISSPFLIWNTIIRQTTLNFQKEGHLTDRLAKAVEQLGAEKTVKKIVEGVTQETSEPNLEVRMGGLLSLERIAQDSTAYDKGRDHVRVMEIICAYIRNNAPASMAKDFPLGDLEPLEEGATDEQREAYLRQIEAREHEREDWLTTVNKPREDIMLALTILERRSDKQRRIEAAHGQDGVTEAEWIFATPAPELPEPPVDEAHLRDAVADLRRGLSAWRNALSSYGGYRPDLRDTCLQKLDLSDFRLQGVRLERARLEGANLMEARLEGADLMEARLEGADLMEARLEGAVLEGARLEGADLMEARLQGAVLEEARLEGADLMEARLGGGPLAGAAAGGGP